MLSDLDNSWTFSCKCGWPCPAGPGLSLQAAAGARPWPSGGWGWSSTWRWGQWTGPPPEALKSQQNTKGRKCVSGWFCSIWRKTEKGDFRSDQAQMLLTEATDSLLQSHIPPVDGQHKPTVPAEWIWTFHDAETELLQEQQTPDQPLHSWPMKPDGSNHQNLNPHLGSDQLFVSYSITMVTTLPLSIILNWKMWILVPVLPASNMMQYWCVGAPDGGLWCSGGIHPARRFWGSRWASSLAASRWRLTNVRYMSRNPRKMKTPASFGTFITTHSVLISCWQMQTGSLPIHPFLFQHITP